jgi:hypothetical protein
MCSWWGPLASQVGTCQVTPDPNIWTAISASPQTVQAACQSSSTRRAVQGAHPLCRALPEVQRHAGLQLWVHVHGAGMGHDVRRCKHSRGAMCMLDYFRMFPRQASYRLHAPHKVSPPQSMCAQSPFVCVAPHQAALCACGRCTGHSSSFIEVNPGHSSSHHLSANHGPRSTGIRPNPIVSPNTQTLRSSHRETLNPWIQPQGNPKPLDTAAGKP